MHFQNYWPEIYRKTRKFSFNFSLCYYLLIKLKYLDKTLKNFLNYFELIY